MMPKLIVINLILIVLFAGCYGGVQTIAEEDSFASDVKINADAYLFDAKLKQEGKPTSVRLYFYQTDSLIGVGGRGYLGKGALKGWISKDSIKILFPTTREYLYESVNDLFSSFECTGDIPEFDLMALFSDLPEKVFRNSTIDVNRIDIGDDDDRREYSVSIDGCLWSINLRYDNRDDQFVIRNFEFDDGKSTSFEGKRREYRKNQEIKLSKFKVPSSPDYIRIIP